MKKWEQSAKAEISEIEDKIYSRNYQPEPEPELSEDAFRDGKFQRNLSLSKFEAWTRIYSISKSAVTEYALVLAFSFTALC
ncbi:MAG: hypothetical protein WAO78_21280 [Roseovarius sp.]